MISTIITTYKRPLLLRRAIASALAQTYPHVQVCIYDNASGDETASVVKEFHHDPRVKYHCHAENIGMMQNYAYAFAHIDTPYFSFLSDDDYLLPHFYEEALKGFEQCPEAVFSAMGVDLVDSAGKFLSSPLNAWEHEGVFTPPNGLLEMLSKWGKFPVPLGALFQSKYACSVAPDWSDEIALVWDPNYLTQLASRFPIVISRKTACIYLVHPGGYASGFHVALKNSPDGLTRYVRAQEAFLQHLSTCQGVPGAAEMYRKILIRDFRQNLLYYFITADLPAVVRAGQFFAERYRLDWISTSVLALSRIAVGSPIFNALLRFALRCVRLVFKVSRFAKRRYFVLLKSLDTSLFRKIRV